MFYPHAERDHAGHRLAGRLFLPLPRFEIRSGRPRLQRRSGPLQSAGAALHFVNDTTVRVGENPSGSRPGISVRSGSSRTQSRRLIDWPEAVPNLPSDWPPMRRQAWKARGLCGSGCRLSLLAIVVGLVTGFGAVVFRALIGLIHNVAFLGSFSFDYDASVFTPPSPWGALIILVPVVGGQIVTFLITKFAPEARGHGVPEVMDAIYYKNGMIRPVVARDQIARLGAVDRHRRRGRPRRPDHPDRRGASARRSGKSSAWRRGSASRWSPPAPAPASPRPSIRRSAA